MDFDSYQRIASTIHWANFDGELATIRAEKFDPIYKSKMEEYQAVKQNIRSARSAKKKPPPRDDGSIATGVADAAMPEIIIELMEEDQLTPFQVTREAMTMSQRPAATEGMRLPERVVANQGSPARESPVTFIRNQIEQSNKKATPLSKMARLANPEPAKTTQKEPGGGAATPSTRDFDDTFTLGSASAYDMTQDKVFLPSTKDNYNVDDLSSNDETDNEEHPRKTIPSWAQGVAVTERVLASLVGKQQRRRHFGRMDPPVIKVIFEGQKKLRRKRGSITGEENMEWESADRN